MVRKIRLEKHNRSQAVAEGVVVANRSLAKAAPSCTVAMPISTISTGSTRANAARTLGLCHTPAGVALRTRVTLLALGEVARVRTPATSVYASDVGPAPTVIGRGTAGAACPARRNA